MKKQWYLFLAILVASLFSLTSCSDDDDETKIIDVPDYGVQIIGSATGDVTYLIDQDQLAEPSSDYAIKERQAGMTYGIYWFVPGDFTVKNISVDGETVFGVSNVTDVVQDAEAQEEFSYKTGDLVSSETTAMAVAEAGLYYIMVDNVNMKVWLMPINNIEINSTGDKAIIDAGGSAAGCSFTAPAVELRSAFKVRLNTAWKMICEDIPYAGASAADFPDDHARPVLSYGGSVTDLTADGNDITIETENLLNMTFKWDPTEKGIAGITIETEDAGELPAAEFPEMLHMTGSSVGNGEWNWETNGIELTPVNGVDFLFWNVQWLEPGIADAGFKFSVELNWDAAFGVDPAVVTDGVYAKGTENVPEVATAGYYTIVVNLETETVEVNPAMIYGIGDAFGGWDAATEAYKYTEDATNKLMVSPAAVADASVRMHIAASTLTDAEGVAVEWWRAEFATIDGIIEYRGTGDDQAAVAITTGQVVSLDFINGTGTIE